MKKLLTIFIILLIAAPVSSVFARDDDSEIKILTSPYYLASDFLSLSVEYKWSKSWNIGIDVHNQDNIGYSAYTLTVIRPYVRFYGTPDERRSLFIGGGYMIKNSAYSYYAGSSVVLDAGYTISGGTLTFDIGFESALSTTLPTGRSTDFILKFGFIL